MKSSDLKKIIKSLVRESLNEILMESFIEKAVKKAINENIQVARPQQKSFSQSLTENLSRVSEIEAPKRPQANEENMVEVEQRRKEMLRKSLGGSSLMTEMFEDTIKNNNSTSQSGAPGDAGISEDALAAVGAYGDWEKFI